MSFKDLKISVAAILKSKPAELSKKEPILKAPDISAKPGAPGPMKI